VPKGGPPTEQTRTLATCVPIGVIDLEDTLFSAIAAVNLFVPLPYIGKRGGYSIVQNNPGYEDGFMVLYFRK
jgi:hypothetical protein